MSLIWIRNEEAWEDHALDHQLVEITSGAPVPVDAADEHPHTTGPVLVRTNTAHGFDRWVMVCAPSGRTRVNGARVPTGICVLSDRDAISLGNGAIGNGSPGNCNVFFSAEHLATVQPFPGKDDRTSCIRCKLPLQPGAPAVRCPAPECGFWHHHSDDQSCWTYTTTCASCGHPTDFDAGYQWSPSEL